MHYEKDEDTKYEKARLVGARALQIAMGAPILVDREEEFDPVKIAKKEYSEGKIPMTVVRSSRKKSRPKKDEEPEDTEEEPSEEETEEEESEEDTEEDEEKEGNEDEEEGSGEEEEESE